MDSHRTTILIHRLIQHIQIRVELDLRESEGVVTSRDDLLSTVTVSKKSALIAAHILPMTDEKPWRVKLVERVL